MKETAKKRKVKRLLIIEILMAAVLAFFISVLIYILN